MWFIELKVLRCASNTLILDLYFAGQNSRVTMVVMRLLIMTMVVALSMVCCVMLLIVFLSFIISFGDFIYFGGTESVANVTNPCSWRILSWIVLSIIYYAIMVMFSLKPLSLIALALSKRGSFSECILMPLRRIGD